MLSVKRMTPVFYTSERISDYDSVFAAFEYFSIVKGEEVFHFIPAEGKEIIINTKSLQVENLGEIFVFQRGSRYIRLPLYQLLLISDLHVHLNTILEENFVGDIELPVEVMTEAEVMIEELEMENR